VRKQRHILVGLFIGLFVGALATAWVLHMTSLHGGSEDYMWLMWPFYLTVWLARHLCEGVGVDWPISGRVLSAGSLRLIYTTNSVALGMAGALCGFLLRIIRARKDTNVVG
jgi:hypothetical protein